MANIWLQDSPWNKGNKSKLHCSFSVYSPLGFSLWPNLPFVYAGLSFGLCPGFPVLKAPSRPHTSHLLSVLTWWCVTVTIYSTCILTSWPRAHQGELSQGHLHLRREIPEISVIWTEFSTVTGELQIWWPAQFKNRVLKSQLGLEKKHGVSGRHSIDKAE